MPQATFDEVLEAIEQLPVDQQADVLEVMRRRLAERGRLRIVEEVKEAEAEFDRGQANAMSVDAVMREIRS